VYASAEGGVEILSPSGERAGGIDLPGAVNFTFGGPNGDVLFLTTDDAIWAAELDLKGA
jgi:gluconolactonase